MREGLQPCWRRWQPRNSQTPVSACDGEPLQRVLSGSGFDRLQGVVIFELGRA